MTALTARAAVPMSLVETAPNGAARERGAREWDTSAMRRS